jgi:hypothetical protein
VKFLAAFIQGYIPVLNFQGKTKLIIDHERFSRVPSAKHVLLKTTRNRLKTIEKKSYPASRWLRYPVSALIPS